MLNRMVSESIEPTNWRPAFAGQFPRRQLQTILVYEDLAAAVRAQGVIHRLATELRPEFELHSQVWKFDLLRHPQLKDEAKAEAIEADVIIISAHSDTELPPLITGWIESWLPDKIGRYSSLIALFNRDVESADPEVEGSPSARPQSASEYLRRTAEIGGMDFFCNAATHERGFNKLTAIIPGRQRRQLESSARVNVHLQPEPGRSGVNGGI
jgi:hypothetical protein